MRMIARGLALGTMILFMLSGCATGGGEEIKESTQSAAEKAVAEAEAANRATTEAGYEWRDTGKYVKYARKLLDSGKDDKAILLANKALRLAKLAQEQAQYESAKYFNNLSQKDKDALLSAQEAIDQIKKEELAKAMSAQVTASKVTESSAMMSDQKLSTTSSVVGAGEDAYTVVDGDSLWGIAGKDEIYSNPYQWPLIYKANRAKIKDADLIYPGQSFDINRDVSSEDIDAAVEHAKNRGAWSVGDVEQSDLDYLSR